LVLQAIPLYVFSALATPNSVLNNIKSIQQKFLWQGTNFKGRPQMGLGQLEGVV
jgi:hypothetical protein